MDLEARIIVEDERWATQDLVAEEEWFLWAGKGMAFVIGRIDIDNGHCLIDLCIALRDTSRYRRCSSGVQLSLETI